MSPCKWRLYHEILQPNLWHLFTDLGACGQVDRALDSRSEGLGFDSQCWPCVEVSGKIHIPHCLGPPARNAHLVHRSKIRLTFAGCCAPTARGGKAWRTCAVTRISGLQTYLYLFISSWEILLIQQNTSRNKSTLPFCYSKTYLNWTFIKRCLLQLKSAEWTLIDKLWSARLNINLWYLQQMFKLFWPRSRMLQECTLPWGEKTYYTPLAIEFKYTLANGISSSTRSICTQVLWVNLSASILRSLE